MAASRRLHKVDKAQSGRFVAAMLAAIPFPDISPELLSFQIGGRTFALRWYALAYIAGLLIGWRLAVMAVRRPALWGGDTPPMRAADVEELLTYVILGVVVGGRLGYVLFYQPGYYLANPLQIPAIWSGGMAFHGGLVGVAVAALLFAARRGVPPGALFDTLALATPPGLLLGRIANFINAELWGRPTDLPWGVVFPGPAAQDCPGVDGQCARHPSQLYEAGLEGLMLGAVLLWLAFGRRALRSPWLLTGVFLAGYGLARFVVEFFRQADPQFLAPDNPFGHVIRLGDAGLTMGQVLTLPMIVLGLVLIVAARQGRGVPA